MKKPIIIGKNECTLENNEIICNIWSGKGKHQLLRYDILRKNFLSDLPSDVKIRWREKYACGDRFVFWIDKNPSIFATYQRGEVIPTSVCKPLERWVTKINNKSVNEYKEKISYCATLRECKDGVLAYTDNFANQILALQWLKDLKK